MIDVALVDGGRIGEIHGAGHARQPGTRLRYVCHREGRVVAP
jgi:hypothetical protein